MPREPVNWKEHGQGCHGLLLGRIDRRQGRYRRIGVCECRERGSSMRHRGQRFNGYKNNPVTRWLRLEGERRVFGVI
jgi:hypothetical protein